MSAQLIRIGYLIAWAVVLFGTLSIAQVPGDWGHGVCGPWGCGPPLQALVGCHLAWLVLLVPLAVFASRSFSARVVRRIGMVALVAGCGGLLWIVVRQWNYAPEYRWQRIGFVTTIQVDFPAIQLVLIGAALVARKERQRSTSAKTPLASDSHLPDDAETRSLKPEV